MLIIERDTLLSDAALFVIRLKEVGDSKKSFQSSLFNDRPGSLVGGVRSCEELPKLESCLCCSSCLGFRLKKLLILPVVVFLLGLGKVGDAVLDSVFDNALSSIGSLCSTRPSVSPLRTSRVARRVLICRHQLEFRETSDRVALLSPLTLFVSHCCNFESSKLPLAVCDKSTWEWLCEDGCGKG